MKDVVLLTGFVAIVVFGYYVMARLDKFFQEIRDSNNTKRK